MAYIVGLGKALPRYEVEQMRAAEHAVPRCCTSEREAKLLRHLYERSEIRKRGTVLPDGLTEAASGGNGDEAVSAVAGASRQAAAGGNGDGPAVGEGGGGVGGNASHSAGAIDLLYGAASSHGELGPGTGARMARYLPAATELVGEACRRALMDASVDAGEVTHLVTVSCTGFAAPNVDVMLIDALGLRRDTQRTHVGFMGCHGAINGLRVAASIAAADPEAVVLLGAVELCTLHLGYGWDPQQIVANALFADGAASLVVRGAGGDSPRGRLVDSGSHVFEDSLDAMTWHIGDHGFRMTLSPEVPELIKGSLPGWIGPWLARRGLTIGDIDAWAVHPGGPRIVNYVEEALGLPGGALDVSREVLRRHGNMSSPTVLMILDEIWRGGGAAWRERSGRLTMALGFGPGLTVEGALFEG